MARQLALHIKLKVLLPSSMRQEICSRNEKKKKKKKLGSLKVYSNTMMHARDIKKTHILPDHTETLATSQDYFPLKNESLPLILSPKNLPYCDICPLFLKTPATKITLCQI